MTQQLAPITEGDRAYDAERAAKKVERTRIALKHGLTLAVVEDYLATLQTSTFDRRVARAELAQSRNRLGW
jgi:hypothetical protein